MANKNKNGANAFVQNPGPNQTRKLVPVMSRQEAQARMSNNQAGLSKSEIMSHIRDITKPMVNDIAKPMLKQTLSQMMSPRVADIIVDGSPQMYNTAKAYGFNPVKMGQSMIDTLGPGSPVFPITKATNTKTVMNSSYGLSKAPEPKPVVLNSGIVPNTYSNDYMVAQNGLCSPMHISAVSLQIPTSSTNSLYTYFTNTICFDLQTRAQSNVGYDLQVSTQFTAAQLLTAFNAAIYALQVYYWYSSILAYEADPRNKNEGMIALRQGITSQVISDLQQLGRRLEDTPIPPRVVTWVKYMNSNYYSGQSQGAPIIKTCFNADAFNNPPATSFPAQALASLNSPANTTVFALLRRSIPQWRVGKLYDVTVVPNFDRNFKSIFANLPSASYANTVFNSNPNSASASGTISYNTFNNRLDGLAYAMCSTYNTATSQYEPGLTLPVSKGATVGSDSRWSWTNNGTSSAWRAASGDAFLALSRDESYAISGTGTYTPHLLGSEKCQSVSSTTLTQTAQNVLDFLFNVNSIPVKGTLSNFNSVNLNNLRYAGVK